MQSKTGWSIALALGLSVTAADVFSDTLYKLIDKNGRVTYSETEPKNFDGKVIRIDIDPNANTMAAPKAPAAPQQTDAKGSAQTENERIIRRRIVTFADRLGAAREKVEATRKAYEEARDNPGESDLDWIARGAVPSNQAPLRNAQNKAASGYSPMTPDPTSPKTSGAPYQPLLPSTTQKRTGARPVPTEEYAARLAALEKAWHDAEDELAKLEKDGK